MTHPAYHSEPNDPGLGQLIPLREARGEIWVDARMLHLALGVGTRFSDWITRRLVEALATEGEDFYSEVSKTPEGGRPATQYHLTVDLAKEVAMLERTPRGKALRRYFIDAERALREGAPAPALQAPPADPLLMALQTVIQIREAQLGMEARVEAQAQELAAVREELDSTPIVGPQVRAVYDLGRRLGQLMGDYGRAWRMFNNRFGLAGYRDLPRNRYDEGLRFLRLQITAYTGQPMLGGDQA
ncbi:antA/AntB antirepressor family protein [Deinococcus radiotolerans]|uniref:AntA/AntB antirepressor domain-containing protein n=1 Tax=Deinococcus radiotolerans TaxID=1309407 RepID=A0ABQ2FQ46_9DEIO|nr:antA/AntB antirepressor family protein [Deinococcus radiotolerans]GGL15604.1 hypothetical protein GCM10010844_38150 [Deinococcus radiotolerans]